VLQPNVCAKYSTKHFIGFSLRSLCICYGLFDADDLMALRALAEAVTCAIHFVPRSKPPHVGQFWRCHLPSFSKGQILALSLWISNCTTTANLLDPFYTHVQSSRTTARISAWLGHRRKQPETSSVGLFTCASESRSGQLSESLGMLVKASL
jgi:hypothetical protein